MELTGKAKEDFEKWYIKNIFRVCVKVYVDEFSMIPESMQYGVYVDWFLTVQIDVDKIMMDAYTLMSSYILKSHCRNLAIKQANDIYNL